VDTSAAAIAADGLVMLSTVAGTDALKSLYLQDAENILGSLSSSYLGPPSGESALFDGFPGRGGTNTALIYGDYYFTEALLRLQNVLDGKPGWVLYSPTVPEPSIWSMMLLGFAGLGFAGYRRARSRPPRPQPPGSHRSPADPGERTVLVPGPEAPRLRLVSFSRAVDPVGLGAPTSARRCDRSRVDDTALDPLVLERPVNPEPRPDRLPE
jgi:hypothetical protein